MERIKRITRQVAATEAVAASFFFSKERPTDLFAGVFFDIRLKAKKLKNQWEDQAVVDITKALTDDLTASGIRVVELKISLGQYRGSRFVTSAKLKVIAGTQANADKLLPRLQTKYSPKYKLKSFSEETKEADYNVR